MLCFNFNSAAEHADKVNDNFALENFVILGFKAIKNFSPDGNQSLKLRVTRLLARAESRIALHDEKLADVDITASAVNKLLHAVGKVV